MSCQSCVVYTTFVGNSVLSFTTSELKYQKPSDSGVNMNFRSAVPSSTKMSVATQQFRRAAILSSSTEELQESFGKIENLLRENDYSVAAITQAKRRSELLTRQLQIQSAEATTQSVRDPGMRTRQSRSESSSPILKPPYLSEELHRIIAREVRKLGFSGQVRLVDTQGVNLKRRLVRSAFVPHTCRVHQLSVDQQQATQRKRGSHEMTAFHVKLV